MVQIDKMRLWESLEVHGAIGGTADGGVCRESLTEIDQVGRDKFVEWCRDAGMKIAIDKLGNIYATRPGNDDTLNPIAMGSHLDTQPTGGKYDGVLGVLGGLEVVRALNDAKITTRRPICIVNWTNEEGSRFVPSMVASGVYAGIFSMQDVEQIQDRDGIRMLDALERIGYAGDEEVGARRFRAFIELHIEQGPVLESKDVEIGVVTGSQAMDWSWVTVNGRAAHAGTTPMPDRLDPLAATVRLLERLYQEAEAIDEACATVGLIDVAPGSHSTIPYQVKFSLDLRHPNKDKLERLVAGFEASMQTERDKGFEVKREHFGIAEVQKFDQDCVEAVRNAAISGGYSHCDITSGAGHDAIYINEVCPSAMIFVPCKDGISHNPSESITPEQAFAGVDVMLKTVIALASID